ncbi:Membrane protein involved in the export of O-antigen and teichoic acid [Chryseobacterium oleae]|uniref:Membrane protein involved in the export of O-antigen and teichoic acid n=1 Tax=Chryseobacterium oleae TaxID=491207 RepID=A0A1I5BCU4_CHROL|nr:oligosaccharide flippase family protein [Chryseobacterium oleae]SFN72523.1 Membrane protein involved in the export of O-antigen and teichoic acid [Chryseobacterium oleae]
MFLNKLKRLNGSHISTIFKGNFISKFVLVMGGLLLAKYYGSSEYGIFSIYLSIMSIFTVVLSLAQEHLIMLEGDAEQVNNNFSTAGIISAAVMILTFLLVFIPFDIPKNIIFLGILSGFLYLFTNNAKFLLAKKKMFKLVSVLTIVDSVVSFLFQVVFVFIKIENGLVIGSLIGYIAAFLAAIYCARKYFVKPDLKKYIANAKKRPELFRYSYPSTLINALGNNIMPILISLYFADSLLGEYSLTVKIMSVPLLLISSSIATVYYPRAAELSNRGRSRSELFAYTKKMSLMNFYIILALYILVNVAGIPLLELFFNKNWEHLGLFIFLMSFGYLTRSLINPIADILTIVKRNNVALIFNIYLFLANIAAIFIGKEKGITYLVGIFSLFLFIGYGFLYFYIMFILKKNESA